MLFRHPLVRWTVCVSGALALVFAFPLALLLPYAGYIFYAIVTSLALWLAWRLGKRQAAPATRLSQLIHEPGGATTMEFDIVEVDGSIRVSITINGMLLPTDEWPLATGDDIRMHDLTTTPTHFMVRMHTYLHHRLCLVTTLKFDKALVTPSSSTSA